METKAHKAIEVFTLIIYTAQFSKFTMTMSVNRKASKFPHNFFEIYALK